MHQTRSRAMTLMHMAFTIDLRINFKIKPADSDSLSILTSKQLDFPLGHPQHFANFSSLRKTVSESYSKILRFFSVYHKNFDFFSREPALVFNFFCLSTYVDTLTFVFKHHLNLKT